MHEPAGEKSLELSSLPAITFVAFLVQGLTLGYFVGISKSPVIQAIIPAVIALVASACTAVVAKLPNDKVKSRAILVGLSSCAILLCVGMVAGVMVGSYSRRIAEARAKDPGNMQPPAFFETEAPIVEQRPGADG